MEYSMEYSTVNGVQYITVQYITVLQYVGVCRIQYGVQYRVKKYGAQQYSSMVGVVYQVKEPRKIIGPGLYPSIAFISIKASTRPRHG